MVVTTIHCLNCGYEWKPRGESKRCPSCFRILGETKTRKWEMSESKFAKILTNRGWSVGAFGGRKGIDVYAEKNGKKLFIDVKSGRNYLIRNSQLKNLIKYWDGKSDVGFACEMNGKFYLLMLKEALEPSVKSKRG